MKHLILIFLNKTFHGEEKKSYILSYEGAQRKHHIPYLGSITSAVRGPIKQMKKQFTIHIPILQAVKHLFYNFNCVKCTHFFNACFLLSASVFAHLMWWRIPSGQIRLRPINTQLSRRTKV